MAITWNERIDVREFGDKSRIRRLSSDEVAEFTASSGKQSDSLFTPITQIRLSKNRPTTPRPTNRRLVKLTRGLQASS